MNIESDLNFLSDKRISQRDDLLKFLNSRNLDAVLKINGIHLFLRNEDFLPDDIRLKEVEVDIRCYQYILGDSENGVETAYKIVRKLYPFILNPEIGDLVLYYSTDSMSPDEPAHMGIFLGNNRVRSKWGQWHVFDHPIDLVPSIYGNVVKFLRL